MWNKYIYTQCPYRIIDFPVRYAFHTQIVIRPFGSVSVMAIHQRLEAS